MDADLQSDQDSGNGNDGDSKPFPDDTRLFVLVIKMNFSKVGATDRYSDEQNQDGYIHHGHGQGKPWDLCDERKYNPQQRWYDDLADHEGYAVAVIKVVKIQFA